MSQPPEVPAMTEESLDMDIEPDQLEVDERTVSEDLQTDISPLEDTIRCHVLQLV